MSNVNEQHPGDTTQAVHHGSMYHVTQRPPGPTNGRRRDKGTGDAVATSTEGGTPQPRHRIVRLPDTLEAPALARQQARAALADWRCGRLDDVQLVCSELVTNAVIHTSAQPTLLVAYTDGFVRVEVHDDVHSAPVIRTAGARVGGFGLHIVSEVSDEWGWTPIPTGKFVWAAFNCTTQ